MKRRFWAFVAIIMSLVWCPMSFAQTSPNWPYGHVPTAGQWNQWFAAKQDWLGYVPVNKAGDTMLGPLITAPSTTSEEGFVIQQGTAPTSPQQGGMWMTASGLYYYIGTTVYGPLAGVSSANFLASAPITVSLSGNHVTYGFSYNPTCLNVSAGALTFASPLPTSCLPIGTSGATVGLLNGNNTYSGNDTFSAGVKMSGLSAVTCAATLILDSGKNVGTSTTCPGAAASIAANATTITSATGSNDVITTGAVTGGVGVVTDSGIAVSSLASITAIAGLDLISGNLPSAIAGTSTTGTVTISAGSATDSTGAAIIAGAGYSWAVANGNAINGYQGGTTLPNSTTIHFFLCNGASGVGSFASTSLTPTCPTGYATYYRRIFSLYTNSSGSLVGGSAVAGYGGSMIFYLTTQVQDVNSGALGTTATLYTLSVPSGVKEQPLIRVLASGAQSTSIILTSPDEADVAPSSAYGTVPGFDESGTNSQIWSGFITTNTSAQIRARAAANSSTIVINTRGWIDFRR